MRFAFVKPKEIFTTKGVSDQAFADGIRPYLAADFSFIQKHGRLRLDKKLGIAYSISINYDRGAVRNQYSERKAMQGQPKKGAIAEVKSIPAWEICWADARIGV